MWAQAYLADAYSYWTQHINMEGDFDRQYLVRHLHLGGCGFAPPANLYLMAGKSIGRDTGVASVRMSVRWSSRIWTQASFGHADPCLGM